MILHLKNRATALRARAGESPGHRQLAGCRRRHQSCGTNIPPNPIGEPLPRVRDSAVLRYFFIGELEMAHYRNGRYRPNKTERGQYARLVSERDELAKGTSYPIRTGCRVRFAYVDMDADKVLVVSGKVISHSYGRTGQHTFTIKLDRNCGEEIKLIRGRNLYPGIIEHLPGQKARRATMTHRCQ